MARQTFEPFFFFFFCKSNKCLSRPLRSLCITILMHFIFFLASSRTGLFFVFFSLRSQVATWYFSPLTAGGADLIQHIQTSPTPCCSPPHSRMAADEARGRGHWAGYSAIIMYLPENPPKNPKTPHIRMPHSFPPSVLVPHPFLTLSCKGQNIIFKTMPCYLEKSPLNLQSKCALFHGVCHVCTAMFPTEARDGQTKQLL